MNKFFSICVFLCLTLVFEAVALPVPLSPFPDPLGRAGISATTWNNSSGEEIILAVGGSNFPHAPKGARTATERGTKVFYDDIYQYSDGQWIALGNLPIAIGYSAFARTTNGMVIAGGCNQDGHLDRCFLIEPHQDQTAKQPVIRELDPLPQPVAYPAFAVSGHKLYVIGGQNDATSTTALNSVYALDLSHVEAGWEQLPDMPGPGRILATGAAIQGKILVMGGCSLKPSNKPGQGAIRTYLNSVQMFDTKTQQWSSIVPADIPEAIAAAANPAPITSANIIYLIGGDTGETYQANLLGKAPPTHPGQSRSIYTFDFTKNQWEHSGSWSEGIATAPAVVFHDTIFTISGETYPGVRTPSIGHKIDECNAGLGLLHSLIYRPQLVDILVISLMGVVLLIIVFSSIRNGVKNVVNLSNTNTSTGKWAWIAVILLWVVVMLNYFDRQLLSALHEPITDPTRGGIAMTESQFGMVTSVFLLVYALLSPVGGFLADRYSRRLVILCSLVVWSAVTWWTGHAQNYTALLIARAAMGVSEAFYIPAALALITDYHRGPTRSIATGIHMSGIYAGMALAGYGGAMSDYIGWRMTFAVFGLVGVLYAFALIFFLREPSDPQSDDTVLPSRTVAKLATTQGPTVSSSKEVLAKLLKGRAMWVLLAIVAFAGAANWFLLTWYPTLLQDTYNLSASEAGPAATLWSSLAKYGAVIIGAIIADTWYKRNVRARALVPGISFTVAGPLIVLALLPGVLQWDIHVPLFIMLSVVATQGIAQGCMDATLMPVLRSHIDEHYSATGYGLLNLTSAGVGALISFFGGWFKDQGIPLTTTLAAAGSLMFICGIMFISLPKPKH